MSDVERVLRLVPDLAVETVVSSCCGMAGSFGFHAETIDIALAMGEAGGRGLTQTPAFCQSAAGAELQSLEARIKKALDGKAELDGYTRSHLSELAGRIQKVLDARLDLRKP